MIGLERRGAEIGSIVHRMTDRELSEEGINPNIIVLGGDIEMLETYVLGVAQDMGLGDWNIEVREGTYDENDDRPWSLGSDTSMAQCCFAENRHSAFITYRETWRHMRPEVLRMVTCHELLHCHLSAVTTASSLPIGAMGIQAYGIYSMAIDNATELAIDTISRAWSTHLDLPQCEYLPEKGEDE